MNEIEKKIVQTCISALMLILNHSETEAYRRATGAPSADPADDVTNSILLLESTIKEVTNERQQEKTDKNEKMALSFNEKEIMKMPKQFKKIFRIKKVNAHVRRRDNGVYEIRCQINKTPITATSKNLETAKEKFISKLNEIQTPCNEPRIKKIILLTEYMLQWLETVKKPYVKTATYKDYMQTFKADITSHFNERELASVKQFEIQKILNEYTESKKYRTAKKIYQLLSAMFEYAVADEIISRSPMQKVKLAHYEQERGIPLTRSEEKNFIEDFLSEPTTYKQAFVFMLYTGIRRAELASVVYSDGWIQVISAKQRKGFKEKLRNIPISPILNKLLPMIDIEEIKKLSPAMLTKHLKKLCPAHHLHDLRHTFITRAQECGIQRELVSLWAGHAADSSITSTVYTHLEYNKTHQVNEIKKFSYDLD